MKKLALAAISALVLSACSLTTEVATQKEYASSDGIRVDLGDVTVENLYFLTDGSEASDAVVYALVSNNSGEEVNVTFEAESADGVAWEWDVALDPHGTQNTAWDEDADDTSNKITEPLMTGVDFETGTNVDVRISSGSDVEEARVPVLSACAHGYDEFYPEELNCPDRSDEMPDEDEDSH